MPFSKTTDYQYDADDNLICAGQKATNTGTFSNCASTPSSWRPRSFSYNSLSELTQSNNPESGTINYTYDNNRDVITKTDGRSITTTYTYDALNRLTRKSYSDAVTPTVYYDYDSQSQTGCSVSYSYGSFTKPLRTAMCDAAGNEAWSYDSMGRVATDQRKTAGTTKITTYSTTSNPYDYDGSLAQITYPTGSTLANTWNEAQQLSSVVDSTHSINYATGAIYSPSGGLASLTNGASLVSTKYYNQRLQPCRISVRSGSTSPSSCGDSTNVGNVMDFTDDFDLGLSDNGDVHSIANNRDTTRNQSFTYDPLNRLASATSSGYSSSPTHCWGESYVYDQVGGPSAWGNLIQINSAGSPYTGCTQESLSVAATSQNRLDTGTTGEADLLAA